MNKIGEFVLGDVDVAGTIVIEDDKVFVPFETEEELGVAKFTMLHGIGYPEGRWTMKKIGEKIYWFGVNSKNKVYLVLWDKGLKVLEYTFKTSGRNFTLVNCIRVAIEPGMTVVDVMIVPHKIQILMGGQRSSLTTVTTDGDTKVELISADVKNAKLIPDGDGVIIWFHSYFERKVSMDGMTLIYSTRTPVGKNCLAESGKKDKVVIEKGGQKSDFVSEGTILYSHPTQVQDIFVIRDNFLSRLIRI